MFPFCHAVTGAATNLLAFIPFVAASVPTWPLPKPGSPLVSGGYISFVAINSTFSAYGRSQSPGLSSDQQGAVVPLRGNDIHFIETGIDNLLAQEFHTL